MTTLTPVLTACPPRPISVAGDQYAAELISGIKNDLATRAKATEFLESTHLTDSTKGLLQLVVDRITNGSSSTSSTAYQLFSRYGGGKTHGMLVLAAAAKYPELDYWTNTAGIKPVAGRVIAFNGEDSNPTTGMLLDDEGHRAKSLAGYLIYSLGGAKALEDFRDGDDKLADPGRAEFQRLIGDEPTIIMIDELVHYINRIRQRVNAGDQVSQEGTLTTIAALTEAVATLPRAVLLITTPEDAHELLAEQTTPTQGDAFAQDALALTDMLTRIESQLGRQIQPRIPSRDSDLPAILRARLFHKVSNEARDETCAAYAAVATKNSRSAGGYTESDFRDNYPFHPGLIALITGRLSANTNFQRVRGTLRLLGNTILALQNSNDTDALIHPHHVDPGEPAIREELVNRIRFEALDAAIDTDVAGPNSSAVKLQNPLAIQTARTLLMATLAPPNVNGLYPGQIADYILSPRYEDYGIIVNEVEAFLARAIHVDDNADSERKRFSSEPNVMKQLLETRDSIRADTPAMENLLRSAIRSAYSAGSRQNTQMQVTIFPNRASNVPDDADQVHLGIINPEFFNWVDVEDSTTQMKREDLVELYHHNIGNNGTDFRLNRNSIMLLVPHDRNLGAIRDNIATMEAADRLLKDPNQQLQEHRRRTVEELRAQSEKNAMTGIQNKWNHLITPGISDAHRWPNPASMLEHRPLSSTAEPAGNGQKHILDELDDRILHGQGANLSPAAWAQVPVIRKQEGLTLRELRNYFAATPAERSVLNQEAWLNLVRTGINNGGLYVETQAGEANPPSGYDPDWLAWGRDYKPDRGTPQPEPEETGTGITPGPHDQGDNEASTGKQRSIATDFTQARVAANSVQEFMKAQDYTWEHLKSCTLTATSLDFADHVASIPQGPREGIAISINADSEDINLELRSFGPAVYKQYASSVRRMLQLAQLPAVDVTIRTDAKGAQEILTNLNNAHTARIRAEFN